MNKEKLIELIDSIIQDKPSQVQEGFKTIMTEKIAERIEEMRKNVASSMFKEEQSEE